MTLSDNEQHKAKRAIKLENLRRAREAKSLNPPARRLNYNEARWLDETIRAHAKVIPPEGPGARGHVIYEAGWNDERIAEEAAKHLGRNVGVVSVRSFRTKFIGELTLGRARTRPLPRGSVAPMMLTVQLRQLRAADQSLELRVASLEEFLAQQGYKVPDIAAEENQEAVGSDDDFDH